MLSRILATSTVPGFIAFCAADAAISGFFARAITSIETGSITVASERLTFQNQPVGHGMPNAKAKRQTAVRSIPTMQVDCAGEVCALARRVRLHRHVNEACQLQGRLQVLQCR